MLVFRELPRNNAISNVILIAGGLDSKHSFIARKNDSKREEREERERGERGEERDSERLRIRIKNRDKGESEREREREIYGILNCRVKLTKYCFWIVTDSYLLPRGRKFL